MVKLFSKNSNLCDHNPPTLQADGQTTCDRNTALCTKVHRAINRQTFGFQQFHNYIFRRHSTNFAKYSIKCAVKRAIGVVYEQLNVLAAVT